MAITMTTQPTKLETCTTCYKHKHPELIDQHGVCIDCSLNSEFVNCTTCSDEVPKKETNIAGMCRFCVIDGPKPSDADAPVDMSLEPWYRRLANRCSIQSVTTS